MVAKEFKAVVVMIPIDSRTPFNSTLSCFSLHRRIGLKGMFKLVIILGTIVSTRAKVFVTKACMPTNGEVIIVIKALIKGLLTSEISI